MDILPYIATIKTVASVPLELKPLSIKQREQLKSYRETTTRPSEPSYWGKSVLRPVALYLTMALMEHIPLHIRHTFCHFARRFQSRINNKVSITLPTKSYYFTIWVWYCSLCILSSE